MANESIKEVARRKRIRLWEIADQLAVSENTLSRRLRHELSPEEKQQILAIISELSRNYETNN